MAAYPPNMPLMRHATLHRCTALRRQSLPSQQQPHHLLKVPPARPPRRQRCKRIINAASAAEANPSETGPGGKKPTALVVGGGWAGFGAAWQLLKLGFEVKLLDASEAPGGLAAGWRTANGRAVEVGVKGFWYHYKNIEGLVEELELDESPFTPYTSSAFWDPSVMMH